MLYKPPGVVYIASYKELRGQSDCWKLFVQLWNIILNSFIVQCILFSFQVFGVGLPNPYRLRPFLGARVPLNFSFSTIINMHNPYDSPLQVSSLWVLLVKSVFILFWLSQLQAISLRVN